MRSTWMFTPAGRSGTIWSTRARTSCRALTISVVGAKSTLISVAPGLVRDLQERHQQVHEAPLATEDVEQRHRAGGGAGLRTMRAPSATPYAPLVTTISPAWSPDRISIVDSLRPPTVTDRAWAGP